MEKMADIQYRTSIKSKVCSLKSLKNVETPQARLMNEREDALLITGRKREASL